MTDPTNDNDRHIDELLQSLGDGWRYWPEKHAALTALVAERDKAKSSFSEAWRERSEFSMRIDEADAAVTALVAERDALQSKIDSMNEAMHSIARRQVALEEEAEERQSIGLRERLACAALNGILSEQRGLLNHEYALRAIGLADATLAAMRKGEQNGK